METQENFIKNKQGKKLEIKLYQEGGNHDQECKKIEQSSGREEYFCGSIQIERRFFAKYSDMLKSKHKQGFIMVVEDQENKHLAAKVCIGIKNVVFNGKKEVASYVYDLRVSSNYQRMGIGYQLLKYIDQYTVKNYQATISFCTINESNKRSQALFKKLGYNFEGASQRYIYIGFKTVYFDAQSNIQCPIVQKELKKINEGDQFDDILQEVKEPDFQLTLLNNYYKDKDLFLQDYSELLDHKKSLGVFVCKSKDNENIAGVHLFKETAENSLHLRRMFCLARNYKKFYVKFLWTMILIMVLLLLQLGFFKLLHTIIDFKEIWEGILYSSILTIVLFAFLFPKLNLAMYIVYSVNQPHIRMNALFYKGKEEHKKRLVTKLIQYVNHIGQLNDCSFFKYNSDCNSEFNEILKHKDVPTVGVSQKKPATIMPYKLLRNESEDDKNYKLNSETFFDPRDV